MSVYDETQKALEALRLPATDAGTSAVMLKLAERIDGLGSEDPDQPGRFDNVSIPTYLKYADALGMTPASRRARRAAPAPADASPTGHGATPIAQARGWRSA